MILINLLPPELRRSRSSGVNPVLLAAAAGVAIVLGLAGTWAWIEFGRIRAAQDLLAQRELDLIDATARADKVKAVDQQIADFEKLHQTITGLITHKVFWARTLDDFANLLAQSGDNRWTREGYEVRCTSLSITPTSGPVASRGAKSSGEAVTFSFRGTFKIVGDQRDQAGNYVHSFFQSVELSRFWRENGFIGRAEDPFRGDSPREIANLNKVSNDLPLEWHRVKIVTPQGVQR